MFHYSVNCFISTQTVHSSTITLHRDVCVCARACMSMYFSLKEGFGFCFNQNNPRHRNVQQSIVINIQYSNTAVHMLHQT